MEKRICCYFRFIVPLNPTAYFSARLVQMQVYVYKLWDISK